ncbi:MAG: hypothetical protein JRF33_22075 [Deltaproteobacteria bacterium]|nr:hypothetical protein [Deltaproteobacteria bacterium]
MFSTDGILIREEKIPGLIDASGILEASFQLPGHDVIFEITVQAKDAQGNTSVDGPSTEISTECEIDFVVHACMIDTPNPDVCGTNMEFYSNNIDFESTIASIVSENLSWCDQVKIRQLTLTGPDADLFELRKAVNCIGTTLYPVEDFPLNTCGMYVVFNPVSAGEFSALLTITFAYPAPEWSNEEPVEIVLHGFVENAIAAMVADLLGLYDTLVSNDGIVGIGPGASGRNRVSAIRNKIIATQELVEEEQFADACQKLTNDILRKCDGQDRPGDFITGDSLSEFIAAIYNLLEVMRCGEFLTDTSTENERGALEAKSGCSVTSGRGGLPNCIFLMFLVLYFGIKKRTAIRRGRPWTQ